MALQGTAVRGFSEPPGQHADYSGEGFSRIQAPMGTVVSPFTKVPRQPRKKEEGAGGPTAQAGCMQQGTPQRSPGKVGGAHGKWDLRVFPIRSARGCTGFIIHDSFSFC